MPDSSPKAPPIPAQPAPGKFRVAALLPWLALVVISAAFGSLAVVAWFYFTQSSIPLRSPACVTSASEHVPAPQPLASASATPIASLAPSGSSWPGPKAASAAGPQDAPPHELDGARVVEDRTKSGVDLAGRSLVPSAGKAHATPEDPGLAAVLKGLAEHPNASGVVVVVVSTRQGH
ncbi:hypothetical protein [Burkholderia pseudomallei]|uniref:hypothetical protein n=1 Tax=Burkholderia pseudomallei TaxID=28450 RepID=UPI000F12A63F|nr:hypothetical protein [Burkholderia pseudomallei]CAJ3074235.1 Uncharacterised protein [Burkholderia pseudomallei]VCK72749.1 Uncharacterised protein [Burkholderia pseudomallei]VCK79966.1 Uncharacterised protein [Burkholderia pseudomallei]VCK80046.1 Uncharacterised protein [Burkholderia pseudomallei]VCK80743.1 Uncharacterised protein [Burkholderia pseudomallei]